jgi:magnesium transporter
MMAEPKTEPGVRSDEKIGPRTGRLWSSEGMRDRSATAQEVGHALRAGTETKAWMFLPRTETEALKAAAERLGLDDLALEDLLNAHEPVKLDWVGESMVAILRAVHFDADRRVLDSYPVSLLAGRRALLILADDDVKDEICRALDATERTILQDGIPAAIHTVVDHLVDGYASAVEALEDAVGVLSEALFDDRPLRREEQLDAFRLQQALSRLRRSTRPMRDVTAGLANAAGRGANRPSDRAADAKDAAEELLGTDSVREFSDVADHADHVAQAADSLREAITSMFETNLALSDVHLNTVMKKLTGWAAIIAVPTLITGFMGMNVPYPGFGTKTAFLVAFGVMVVAVVILFVTLRRKNWI